MDWHALVSAFSRISLDWIVLAVFAFLVAVDALRSGPSRATALALALPLTLLVAGYMQGASFMSGIVQQLSSPILNNAFTLILLAILFICMYRITDTFGADSAHPIQTLLTGLAVAAIAAVVWVQIPSLESIWHFGPQAQALFGAAHRFWWLLAGYIALAFARG